MAKQLNVNMKFTADTGEAKAQLQSLQQSLKDIAKMPGNASNLFDDSQIKKASQAALELQAHLTKAVNVDTGKLDLSRFASSLKTSNRDLTSYANTLLSTGHQGQQAFLQLAQAIAAADTPVTRINAKLMDLGVTLKNTAKWQISSSVLHGFMGTVQSAYGYAQDLNRSLNDIRIVTGQNIEQMAKFAENANRAAKALSTTTTDYTNASLIYYQQGLDDSEVKERTDITIKMANAAGQSAQIVSDQMTAVWNNFDDGSKSLEYYADVMTALGAATASSTDEIAAGLEKFAAISGTVGLSYEYATAALATVTDRTRQSAEVVGTAFKAMFARIQGLELGETLEDGTNLNKYSEALASVGVNIKDANGELKNMDVILEEMADVWATLSRDQQVALAQTVAGVRQYNQLVSLMENWDAMEMNLNVVGGSEGELQKQADIYAESWEAAQDRVRAAAENIYQNLIDDEFFIDLLNGFEKVLDGIGGLVEGFGGMKGVISLVGSLFLSYYAQKMPDALNNLKQNLMVFTGQANKEMLKMQDEMASKLSAVVDPNSGYDEAYRIEAEGILKVTKMKQDLLSKSKNLTQEQKEYYQATIQNVEAIYKEVVALQKAEDAAKKKLETSKTDLAKSGAKGFENLLGDYQKAEEKSSYFENKTDEAAGKNDGVAFQQYDTLFEKAKQSAGELEAEVSSLLTTFNKVAEANELETVTVEQWIMALQNKEQIAADEMNKLYKIIDEITGKYSDLVTKNAVLESMGTSTRSQAQDWKLQAASMKEGSKAAEELKSKMSAYIKDIQKLSKDNGIDDLDDDFNNFINRIDEGKDSVNELANAFEQLSEKVSTSVKTATEANASEIEKLEDSMNDMKFEPEKLDQMKKSAQDAAAAVVEKTNALQNGRGAAEEHAKSTFHMSTALSQFSSVAMSAYATITSLKSAFEVFENPDASGLEKLGAAVSVLTSVLSTYGQIQSFVSLIKDKDTIAAWNNLLATVAGTAAKGTETKGLIANAAAWIFANTAMGAAGATLLAITGIIAGVVLAVGALVLVIKAVSDAYNADAIEAKKAAETAKELGEMYDQAAEKYQNMVDTMSQYEEAQNSLNQLTKGTKEYTEALNEANRVALELIQNNPGQFKEGEDYSWEGDQLKFKDGVLEKATQEAAQQESSAYAAKQFGQVYADQAQAKANQTEFSREARGAMGIGDGDLIVSGLVNGITASLGVILAPATHGLSLLATGAAALDQGKKIDQAEAFDASVSKIIDAYQTNQNVLSGDLTAFTSQMNDIGITDTKLIEALYENRTELQNLAVESKNAADSYKLATEAAVRELLGNNKTVQNSENKDAVVSRSADILGKEHENELNKLEEEGWGTEGISKANGANQAAKDVWQEYAEAAGLKGTTLTDTSGTDENRIFEYLDAEGETKQVTLEAMKEIVATSRANEKTDSVATKLTQVADFLDGAIANASKNGVDQSTITAMEGAKTGLLSGDFSEFSGAELDTLSGIDPEEYLTQMFGPEYESMLQELGFKNAEEYISTFSDGIANAKDILTQALANLGEDSPLAGLAKDASASAVQSIANQSARADDISEGGGAQFESNINSILSTVGEADQGAAFEALANIDWSQLSAPEEAIDALGRLGINSEETEKKIIELTGSMRELNGADLNDLNTALDSDVDVEEYERLAEHIQDVADETEGLSEDLKYNEKAAKKTAEAILRFDKAIQKVDDNYDDWKHTLESGSLQDQAEVVDELKDAYADMLDIDMDSLSDDFVKNADNLELMKKAANGSEEAYKELQRLAGEDILMQIGIDKSQYETDLADINALALETEGLGLADIEAGASLNNEDFLNGLTDIVNQAGMTAQEATDYLASMGVDAEIEEVESTSTDTSNFGGAAPVFEWQEKTFNIPILGEQTIKVPKINWQAFTVPSESEKTTTATGIKVTSANKSSGGGLKHKHSKSGGGTGGTGKKGGGGGNSTPKPAETVKKTKKSDMVERYKEITDSLDDNTRALDKANKKADQLYGPGRIKWLKESNKLIKEENKLLDTKIDALKTNLDLDRQALQDAAKAAGLKDFSFDDNGNISNYTTQMEALHAKLNAEEDKLNGFKTKEEQDEYSKKYVEPLKELIAELEAAMGQYEETREMLEDAEDQYEDNLVQLFNNDLEIITIAVELDFAASEAALDFIEYQLKKIEDQAFSTADAMALVASKIPELQARQDNNEWRKEQTLATLVEHEYFTQDDVNNFNAGNMDAIDWTKIPESAMNELLAYREELYAINESYMEIRDTINGSVIEAFNQWSEEMREQLDMFDHYDKVIDSYKNIADLGGKRLGISDEDMIAYGQEKVNNANNRVAGNKKYYDDTLTYKKQVEAELEDAKRRYAEYEAAGDEDGMAAELINIQAWEDTLDVVTEEAIAAEEEFLSSWEEALEISRDAFLAETEIELKALEESMAGTYGSIEAMREDFDRQSEISERYLEDYERIYELSKLQRDLSKKLDETSNVKAKQELAKLQEEILSYQEEGRKMSEYDLEYLQKRYDLKLAEIAMEEAQNAKTQVRLTRDAEGNYSYTYTADEDSMADAQQTYEDKLFEITDLSNEHIKEQTEALLSTQQEYLDALREIHEKAANGQYETTEEYQKALDDCTAYYTEKMRYHGGEIDKATLNNAVVYADDYATYERYIGRKLTEAERLQLEMDADIIEAKAQVEKLTIERQAALDEIHRLNAEGYYATDAEYQAALAKVDETYGERIKTAQSKVDTTIANREILYGKDATAYDLEAKKKEASEQGFVTSVQKYLPQLKEAHGSATGYVKTMTNEIGDAKTGTGYLGKAVESYKALETNVDKTMTNAGSSVKGFKDDIKKKLITDTDSVANQSKKTVTSINNIGKAAENLNNSITFVKTWQKDYSKQVQAAITKNEALIKSINDAQAAAAKQGKELAGDDGKKCTKCKKNPCECKPATPTTNDDPSKDGKLTVGETVTANASDDIFDYVGAKGESQYYKKDPKYTVLQVSGDWVQVRHHSLKSGVTGWLKKSSLKSYDTGGYTGDWGPDGRLAVLHEKELILNQQDTENMLKIISMVRDLVGILDVQAYSASLAKMSASNLSSVHSFGEKFEQTVTIHAEFPEAVYASEIETALNNLVNSASQYANRKY